MADTTLRGMVVGGAKPDSAPTRETDCGFNVGWGAGEESETGVTPRTEGHENTEEDKTHGGGEGGTK